jgi:hypothetical protein
MHRGEIRENDTQAIILVYTFSLMQVYFITQTKISLRFDLELQAASSDIIIPAKCSDCYRRKRVLLRGHRFY